MVKLSAVKKLVVGVAASTVTGMQVNVETHQTLVKEEAKTKKSAADCEKLQTKEHPWSDNRWGFGKDGGDDHSCPKGNEAAGCRCWFNDKPRIPSNYLFDGETEYAYGRCQADGKCTKKDTHNNLEVAGGDVVELGKEGLIGFGDFITGLLPDP